MRALVLQHARTGPPGLLGEWLTERGIAYDLHDSSTGQPLPELHGEIAMVASLGAAASPRETEKPAVADEQRYLARAVDMGIPVLGLCYGGQALAAVLGAELSTAEEPELGWQELATLNPGVVPAGPWLSWHYDVFTLPPGAELLARNERSVQAFRQGPHLGVQFHPESTIDIVRVWAHKDAERIAAFGYDDPDAIVDSGAHHAKQAAANAHILFDAFYNHAKAGSLTR